MVSLAVIVDLGSSQTRVVWSVDGGEYSYHFFSSHCSLATVAQSEQLVGDGFIVTTSRRSYAVGDLAEDSPLAAGAVEAMKLEASIPRILAALHVALSDSGLNQPSLELVVLLPSNEKRSSATLETVLRKVVREFGCNGVTYSLTFEALACVAEGMGVLNYMVRFFSASWEDARMLTVMAGYRDLSLLSSVGVNLRDRKTARLGLLWLLKDVEEQVGDLDRLGAAQLLYELKDESITAKACQRLARVKSAKMRATDGKLIAKAMRTSRKKYLEFIDQMFESLRFDCKAVLLVGGTGDYLSAHLEKRFGERLRMAEPLVKRIERDYGLERSQAIRCTDVFGVAFSYKRARQVA